MKRALVLLCALFCICFRMELAYAQSDSTDVGSYPSPDLESEESEGHEEMDEMNESLNFDPSGDLTD